MLLPEKFCFLRLLGKFLCCSTTKVEKKIPMENHEMSSFLSAKKPESSSLNFDSEQNKTNLNNPTFYHSSKRDLANLILWLNPFKSFLLYQKRTQMKKSIPMNTSNESGRTNLFKWILPLLLLLFNFSTQEINAQTMSGVDPATYNEGSGPIVLYPGFTFTGGSNYGGGYMLFDISNGDAQDQLAIFSDPDPTVLNAISVVGTGVYLGNGSGSDIIGSIDPVLNGQNGQDLKINFTSNFNNPSFENGTAGWTVVDQNVNLGVTVIGGYVSPETGTYPSQTSPANDDAPGSLTYSSGVTTAYATEGSYSLQMSNNGISGGYDVVHGGYAISDPFQANGGDDLYFDWRAIGGGDAYDVFGYLLNVNTGATTIVLDQTGGFTTPWNTATVTVPSNGTYSFVFVSGTFDASGGTVLGASLYIDNVLVFGDNINPAILTLLGQHVTYENTCGTSDATRDMDVTVENGTGVTTTESSTIALVTYNPVITCPGTQTAEIRRIR
jgi:hypothetical protein